MANKRIVELTPAQQKRLLECHNGVGIIAYKSDDNTICSIEFFIKPDGALCNIHDGRPIQPLDVVFSED